ncbi:Serine/threonine protein kinase [Olavius sp. associated proteobacterium Delta 1]|nr:Serine/threonine protein kinase [Olavius sp. associated proteobacterium Delta 1]
MSNCRINIFETGSVLNDKWVILELIGKGAMGEIYLAHQLNLKRDVAIKVVSEELLKDFEDDPEEIETAFQRFKREVHAMAQVRHPNVLQIFDYGSAAIQREAGDCPVEFIAMEYIPGDTLRFTMSDEGFYPEQDLTGDWLEEYFLPMLNGIEAIHDLGIVHRDIKPENILMDDTNPKIADFGLARSTRLKPVTQSMDVKGTAHYMSPEHFFDFRKADQRADIYSLGKILFEAVTGKLGEGTIPFKTASLPETETLFFEKLDKIIQDATAENRENRLASIEQLRTAILDAIDAYKKEPEADILARSKHSSFLLNPKWIWSGIVIAIIAVSAMAIWHLMGEPGNSSKVLESPPIISNEVKKVYRDDSSPIEIMPSDTPKQSILAEDGASMHFVPAGTVTLPNNSSSQPGRSVKVNPFYMDETLVTNHQYVEFLNHNLSRIRVERGVVRAEEEIWLLLGEISEDYEPIVFQIGEFKVSKIAYASLPALRVTAYGAAGYARYYNRRLPTYIEWLHALGNGELQFQKKFQDDGDSPEEADKQPRHGQMHSQVKSDVAKPKSPGPKLSSVINDQPNRYGIRGLNKNIKEWGLKVSDATSRDNIREAEFVVLPSTSQRFPWEGFGEVGFRCVREVKIKRK